MRVLRSRFLKAGNRAVVWERLLLKQIRFAVMCVVVCVGTDSAEVGKPRLSSPQWRMGASSPCELSVMVRRAWMKVVLLT